MLFRSSLQADLEAAFERIQADAVFKKLARLEKRKDQLDQARAYALKLIFDEKRYFYPYRGTGRMGEYTKVQQEVDRRVDAVREIWDKDRTVVHVRASKELKAQFARFDNDAAELKKRLVDVEDKVAEVAFLHSYLGKKFTVRNFYRTPEEFELLRYSDEVMEDNTKVEGDITPPEREQVRITNEYRKMFGRWAVRLVEKLVLSSRGHCEEMSRLGYFGHFSPTPGRRTPYDRMKLAGYQYGASENLILGRTNPQAAHDGWCHSSGHHRNLLMEPWTEMGTGQYGRYMGQNFGRAPRHSKSDIVKKKAGKPREWEEDEDPGWVDPEEDGDGEGEDKEPGYDYGEDEG